MKNYRKAIVAVAGFLAVLGAALQDASISPDEAGVLVVSALTALGVWGVKNTPAA